ncbi:trypsin-like peptidase domain-containing protein [Tropicibacter naphthalenivorans]|uniref:His-Xaa-Ser repeat protein HxsA n=1 Tax=Tropicibacter naphthalenivorans TaxID=441103 RepID=A0A0P1G434_9RHOB|nr:trypsin-like peptidase domain-containing protein [Tropicibacter naphthalenivorans]CUH76583.1 His-Xaa-Ser repeat protein HxsA [Tropicibacter naphthalenivorans]SMC64932.1 Sporulation related domain-containing protein [Tropicibacter naphthalenivorans]
MKQKVFALTTALFFAQGAFAQEDLVYIQVEARTSLSGAQQSVQNYAQAVQDVNGFSLGGGWYGVAIGPYTRERAQEVLGQLLADRAIPADSYIEPAQAYGQQFFPVGAQADRPAAAPVEQAEAAPVPAEPVVVEQPEPVAAPVVEAAPEPEPEETVREARASERQLNRAERDALQIALKWAGFYQARIDGAFGPGTRRSMAAWQEANGHEATGVLTTRQRAQLLAQYNAVLDGMDLSLVADARSGISMELPLGAVKFDRYEAPFALFNPTGMVEGAQVLLISQPGDRSTMNGLYEIMQTLRIVPVEGARERRGDGFTLTGANDRIVSHTEVSLRNGEIKGFTLVWPANDEERRSRILDAMQASFERTNGVLDPAAVTDEGQAVDLVSGLEVRTPKLNASGFFVESRGTVLTSAEAVAQCDRVTLNGVYEARVMATEPTLGVAVLTPEERIAPRGVAQFLSDVPRIQSEVAVAGYSFGGVLTAPTMTFGTLEDVKGLGGEDRLTRLALASLPGDTGGPVFDAGGSVMGMLLPRQDPAGRQLPDQVSFAASGRMVLNWLRDNGIQPVARATNGVMDPEDLTALASDMTVLVSCWE